MHQSHSHHQPAAKKLALSCYSLSAAPAGYMIYENVGISLLEGAVCVISGANGCGKSTLLAQLAGLTQSQGRIEWFETKITSVTDYDRDMLYIGDNHALYPELTVAQQLDYLARLWGNRLLIPATIRYMQLEPYLDVRIGELSAGWTRRVALSRLLLIPSLLWLLDEPMMHLDEDGLLLLGGMLQSHSEKGGVSILTMPSLHPTPSLYDMPVSVLQLEDFIPDRQVEL